MLSGLVVAAVVAGALKTSAAAARGLSALLTGLVRVDLSMGELAGADTAVRLAILAETVVLCLRLSVGC